MSTVHPRLSDLARWAEFVALERDAADLPRGVSGHLGPWREEVGARILFSAPHEAPHWREGAEKSAERGTGPLAFTLARSVGGSAICTADGQKGDPNWDLVHPYVDRVAALAGGSPVIDLHMMRPREDNGARLDVCIGLGPHPTCASKLWHVLASETLAAGLRTAINWPFSAPEVTVTGKLQRLSVPAIQIELSFDCFDPSSEVMALAWTALGRAAQTIAEWA